MDESLTMVMLLLILISAALPFIDVRLKNRQEKIRMHILQTANDHKWISIEEISGIVGVSSKTVAKNIEWGINERIIVGVFESNMFERSYQRTPEEVTYYIPYDEEDL
ncbi:MAG: hypothetical protein ACTSWA_12310 [Candidatus Thorarchaeota archaeon]